METKNWYSLDESAGLIAQSLFPESEEEDVKNILERGVAKSEHKKALIKSAKAGEVILHCSYLVPILANEILFHLKHNARLLKANLEEYASNKLGITLIMNVAPAPEAKKVKQDLSIRNDAIRKDAEIGLTNLELQKKYGLSQTRISEICNEEKKTIGGSQNVMANVARTVIKK